MTKETLALAAGIAVIACGLAVGWSWNTGQSRPDSYESVTGVVIEIHERRSATGQHTDFSTTILVRVDGAERIFASEHGNATTRAGDPVTIWYEPGNAQATLETNRDRMGGTIWLGIAAGLIVMAGGTLALAAFAQQWSAWMERVDESGHESRT